jgi:hypothetical protein
MDNTFHRMSDELFEKILMNLENYHVRKICLYKSNEPFSDKDILERITIVQQRFPGTIIELSSNFILVDKEKSKKLVNILGREQDPKHWVWITCSGIDQNTYDIQQGGHSLSLKDAKRQKLDIDFNKVVKNIMNFFEYLKSSGLKINVQLKSYGNMYSKEDFENFWKRKLLSIGITNLNNININYGGTDIQSRAGQIHADYGKQYSFIDLYGCSKNWLDSRLSIESDGTLTACCHDWKREGHFPSLNDMTIEEAMLSDPIQNFFDRMHTHKLDLGFICSRCEFVQRRCEL